MGNNEIKKIFELMGLIVELYTRNYRQSDISQKTGIPEYLVRKALRDNNFSHSIKLSLDNLNEGQKLKAIILAEENSGLLKYYSDELISSMQNLISEGSDKL